MSVVFFLFALLLAALAVLIVVPVILRGSSQQYSDRQQKNVQVAKQRLEDLQQRESSGEIKADDAEQIRAEIEYELLQDVHGSSDVETHSTLQESTKGARWVALAIAIFVPLTAGTIYLAVGEPGSIVVKQSNAVATVQQTAPVAGDDPQAQAQNFEQLTQRLLTHLSVNTDDVLGWQTLAQLFLAQQQFAEAAGAYKKVRDLEGDSAETLVREADALAMANNGVLQGTPESLIETALQIDPEYTSALWLAGLAAGERGDVAQAVDFWKRAEKTTNNAEMLAEIRRLIESGTAQLAQGVGSDVTVGGQKASSAITVKASIESSIVEQLAPDTVVFLFARAFNGPPAPLAVLKKQVKDFPITATLDDSLAMLPNLTISAFDQVFIVARVSFSGTPQAQSGDYFGQSAPIRPGIDQGVVEITISQRVP